MAHKSYVLALLAITGTALASIDQINNVCSTLEGYFDDIATNPNCWYDPEVNGTPKERAEINGFLLEEHRVTTDDGHILMTFHLKSARVFPLKEVVFLQHGLIVDAISFMSNKENSIAYFLANQGFDVWLGNFRGCEYCEHETLEQSNPKYWDFSYHEHGLYDIPANLKYIKGKTKRKIIYIGHSMGTTSMVVYSSTKPDEVKQYVKHAILITPAIFLRHTKGLAALETINNYLPILTLFPMLNYQSILRKGTLERQTFERFAFGSLENAKLLLVLLDALGGESQYPIVPEKLSLTFTVIKTLCVKAAFHYLQSIQTKEFRMFDYGAEENMIRYKKEVPPDYNLTAISLPLSLIYATTDNLATKEDVIYFFNTYRKPNWEMYEIRHNHFDFLFSSSARKTILPLLLNIINNKIE